MVVQHGKQVEQFGKACHPCQLVGPRSKTEPIRSTTLPEVPWGDIAVDLLEIPSGSHLLLNHLLVVVDNYSRWPEVILLPRQSTLGLNFGFLFFFRVQSQIGVWALQRMCH